MASGSSSTHRATPGPTRRAPCRGARRRAGGAGRRRGMNTEPIKHATFSVERTYPADAARVFRAFSDTDVKRRWFAEGEDWRVEEFAADFRPAGYERSRFRYADGPPITYDTRYLDIVTDDRLVFSYVMTIDGRLSSVSLASVELFLRKGEPASSTPSRGSTSTAVTRCSNARSAVANCTTPSVRCWRLRTERTVAVLRPAGG